MADKKISELPIATPPTGVELLPIVQAGVTDQTTVANLTLGRVVDAQGYTVNSNAIVTEAGTTKTLSVSDNGKVIYCTASTAVTITTAAGLGVGFSCSIIQGGTGQVSIVQGASTTLLAYSNLTKTVGQYAVIIVFNPVANTFILSGNLGS